MCGHGQYSVFSHVLSSSVCNEAVSTIAAASFDSTAQAATAAATSATALAGLALPPTAALVASASALLPASQDIEEVATLTAALRRVTITDLPTYKNMLAQAGTTLLSYLPLAAGLSKPASRLDALCDVANSVATVLNSTAFLSPVDTVCQPSQVQHVAKAAAVLTGSYYAAQGPMFFFGSLVNSSAMVLPGESEADIWRNRFGQRSACVCVWRCGRHAGVTMYFHVHQIL